MITRIKIGIKKLQSAQLEACEDAISRQAAIDALMEIMDRPNHAEFLYTDEICKTLNELPSVKPEQSCKFCEYARCVGNSRCRYAERREG